MPFFSTRYFFLFTGLMRFDFYVSFGESFLWTWLHCQKFVWNSVLLSGVEYVVLNSFESTYFSLARKVSFELDQPLLIWQSFQSYVVSGRVSVEFNLFASKFLWFQKCCCNFESKFFVFKISIESIVRLNRYLWFWFKASEFF